MGLPRGEASVLRGCLDVFEASGIMAWRNNTGAMRGMHKGKEWFVRFGVRGASDIFALLPWGRFCACEVKAPAIPLIGQQAGKLSRDQVAFLVDVNLNGGVGIWVSDVQTLVGVLLILKSHPWAQFRIDGSRIEEDLIEVRT